MSRVFFLIREALVNLRRNLLVVAGAILAVFISLSLAFGALIVSEVLRINTLAWQEGVHVISFLKDAGSNGVPADAHEVLLAEVLTWDEVERAFYVDKAAAWVEFQEIFQGQDELLAIDPSVLPASIRIELIAIELHSSVKFKLEQQQQVVLRVQTAAEEIEQLQSLSQALNVLGIGMAVVLGLSAIVLIANTIRLRSGDHEAGWRIQLVHPHSVPTRGTHRRSGRGRVGSVRGLARGHPTGARRRRLCFVPLRCWDRLLLPVGPDLSGVRRRRRSYRLAPRSESLPARRGRHWS